MRSNKRRHSPYSNNQKHRKKKKRKEKEWKKKLPSFTDFDSAARMLGDCSNQSTNLPLRPSDVFIIIPKLLFIDRSSVD